MDADAARLSPSGPAGRTALAAAFALLFCLSFPFRAGETSFDLGIFAGWGALVPFILVLRGLAPRRAFLWGTAAGTLAFSLVLYWIYVVVHVEAGAPAPIAVLATVLLALYCGLHLGLVGYCVAWLEPRAGRLAPAVFPCAWVVAEHLRSFSLFGGFPWAYLGYSAHENGPVLALASLGGVYLISLGMAVFAWLASRARFTQAVAVLAGLHAAGFATGLWQLPEATAGDPPLRAALVQGNIPQGQKWDPSRSRTDFLAHVELSRLAAQAGDLDLILWPEASVASFLEIDRETQRDLADLARQTSTTLVVGSLGFERPDRDRLLFFNSAFSLGPDGVFTDRYDKARLVPFGEYVPLESLLGFVVAVTYRGDERGQWTTGAGPRVLRGHSRFTGDHALSALICYEVVYPDLVREAVRGGARILLNLTNDAWYGWTSAPEQFLAIAAVRSAEHGLPMLRAANTGVTAVIDSGGRVRSRTALYERTVVTTSIPSGLDGPTLYTRVGDWPVHLGWVLIIAIGGHRVVRSRSGCQGGPG